ncbi:MAG: hypothetical protein KIT17_21265 [Rubrivivax sp.]|nr:hypothetical protein [Rubrivivax sp.]
MKLPIETRPALWGAAGGALLTAIVGFTWGGWTTGSKAETLAATRADDAVVAVLAPLCAERFERAGDATTHRAALVKLDSWTQGEYVEKGGWATLRAGMPADQVAAVARACAVLLVKPSA